MRVKFVLILLVLSIIISNSLLWKQSPHSNKEYNKCARECYKKGENNDPDIILRCIRDKCDR